jgi:hypothetical protein
MGLIFVVGEHNAARSPEGEKRALRTEMGLIFGNTAAYRADGAAQQVID